jgi:hypothetical protein
VYKLESYYNLSFWENESVVDLQQYHPSEPFTIRNSLASENSGDGPKPFIKQPII